MKLRNICQLAGVLMLVSFSSQAANVSNSYFFIENQVDGEYFITPQSTDPRFSGANAFTKYASGDQRSLGYMGYTGLIRPIRSPISGWRILPSLGHLSVTAV